MCRIDAVSSRNWAHAIRTPAAMSCVGESSREVKAKAAATMKEAAAKVFSNLVRTIMKFFKIRQFDAD